VRQPLQCCRAPPDFSRDPHGRFVEALKVDCTPIVLWRQNTRPTTCRQHMHFTNFFPPSIVRLRARAHTHTCMHARARTCTDAHTYTRTLAHTLHVRLTDPHCISIRPLCHVLIYSDLAHSHITRESYVIWVMSLSVMTRVT